jgi:two-component system KDP operon response regulator KdpE
MLGNTRVRLTRKEYSLLHVLASNVGIAVPHQQLLREIWGEDQIHNTQYLRILVRQTRSKIEVKPGDPKILTTESGFGYRLEVNLEEGQAGDGKIAGRAH